MRTLISCPEPPSRRGHDPAGAPSYDTAHANLQRFVLIHAAAMRELAGFGWEAAADAPADYRSLLRAYARSRVTGSPLPVSDEHSEPSIYGGLDGNVAFRFWHDLTHVLLGRGFDLDGEVEVANAQLDVLHAAGFKPGTLEFELFHADTLGQTLCGAATGAFPRDQACFARVSLESSLTRAIQSEWTRS
jgi:hypothetical protein